jgi:hypothetical protein
MTPPSEAENFKEDKLLTRRIQVTKDLVTLSQLCEPNPRGNRINWGVEEPLPVKEESLECPTDVCIFYSAALMRVWKDASVVLSVHEFVSVGHQHV